VAGDHIDGVWGAFEIVSLLLEGLEYRKEFLIMDVVVLLVVLKAWEWKAMGCSSFPT